MSPTSEFNVPQVRRINPQRWRWVVVLVGMLGIVASVTVHHGLRVREHSLLSNEFHHRTSERAQAVERESAALQAILKSVASYVETQGRLDVEGFKHFVDPLLARYPAIQALSCNRLLSGEELQAYEAGIRGQSPSGFRVTQRGPEGGMIPVEPRPLHVVVEAIEPYESNQRALGYDIASEPSRLEAVLRARATGRITATGPITLIQETEGQLGFLLVIPIQWEDGSAQKEAVAVGVFRAGDLVDIALSRLKPAGIDFDLLDLTDPDHPTSLHYHRTRKDNDLSEESAPTTAALTNEISINVAERSWMVVARSTPMFESSYLSQGPRTALILGLLITAVVSGFLMRVTSLTRQLQLSERNFRQLAEHIHEVFWTINAETNQWVYVSPAYETIFQRKVTDLDPCVSAFDQIVHPDDREDIAAYHRELLAGRASDIEYRILLPDGGETCWLHDRGFPVLDRTGHVERLVGVATNVTKRKIAERERDQLQQQIQRTEKLKGLGILAGGIAHHFNNLLTTILGHAELTLMSLPRGSAEREKVESIERAGQQAATLTQQILAYGGGGRLVVDQINFSSLVEEMAPLLVTTHPQRTAIHYDLSRTLPPITADPSQIQQILVSLITNAAEAIGHAAGRINVRTFAREVVPADLEGAYVRDGLPEGNCVFLEVSDDGCGMDTETLQHIFDPFFSTKFVGRGLGLAAVIGIVRNQQGAIQIDSTPGQGTTFRILFPVQTANKHTTPRSRS